MIATKSFRNQLKISRKLKNKNMADITIILLQIEAIQKSKEIYEKNRNNNRLGNNSNTMVITSIYGN